MVQALSLWTDLMNAYHGKNSFGGDTAEIYMYRFTSSDPSAEAAVFRGDRNVDPSSFMGQARIKQIEGANESLHNLLEHFAKTQEARVEIDGKELGAWVKTAGFAHRVHVKVVR